MLVVVIGPQTRLARALLNSSSWRNGTNFVLVARHIREYGAVRTAYPNVAVYRAWEPGSPLPEEETTVAVLCCAFGAIHPEGEPAADLQKSAAECATLETIISNYSDRQLHIVFVSSVLALCPRPGREYYAGWKNVAEGLLRKMVQKRPGTRLSVLYPGRLIEKTKGAGAVALLYTRYEKLAAAMVSVVEQERCVDAIVGLDARLWLALRSLRLAWSGLTRRR